MDRTHFPAELADIQATLPDLVAEMETRVPYAAALVSRNAGQRIRVTDREQDVSEMEPRQGIVLTVWTGAAFEEAANSDLQPERTKRLAREFVRSLQVVPSAEVIDPGEPARGHYATSCEIDPNDMTPKQKLDRCRELHAKARGLDPRIVNVQVSYQELHEVKAFANRARQLSQIITRLRMMVVMAVSDGTQIRYDWLGKEGTGGLELLEVTESELESLCHSSVALLTAEKVLPGMCDVIGSPDVSGVIAHEAFGHGVELDMFLKHRARSRQYLGQQIASPLVSILDDPSYGGGHGSYFFDDEGELARPTYIIRDGVFERGISDLGSAHSLRMPRSANGRRESIERKVYARMSNTFFAPGTTPVEAMIESVDQGVYLNKTSSGMEDPKGWGMQVTSHYGEEIRHGKRTGRIFAPIGITGYVPDILKSIVAVGDDFQLSGGTCGKGHKEWVPVSSGGPHLKLRARLG